MKEILIFIAVAIAFIISCFKFYQIPLSEDKVTVTNADYIAKNGKYKYQNINVDTFNYIKKYNNGRIYKARKLHPKVVVYTNVVDTDNPYRKKFQKTMGNYSHSTKWKKGYNFLSFNMHMVEDLSFASKKEEIEYFSFSKDCDYFCIIDLRKKLIFKGVHNSDNYVGSVLYAFFNN